LNLEANIYDEVISTAAENQRPRIRDVLGMFHFRGDDIYKQVGVLSGGEKARVSLTKILLSPVNFLIMDEPTNHLDMLSKEALEHALMHYNGTLILISHDRYFLDKIVSRVVELKDRCMSEYPGDYSYYLQKRDAEPEFVTHIKEKTDTVSSVKKTKEQKRLEAEARQTISKERNRLKKIVGKLEKQIETLETKKAEIEFEMTRPEIYENGEQVVELQKTHAKLHGELEDAYRHWEEAQHEFDELMHNS